MYIYMHIIHTYVCIYVYAYIYAHIHASAPASLPNSIHVNIHIHLYTYTYKYRYIHIRTIYILHTIYVYIHIYIYIYIHTRTHTWIHTCLVAQRPNNNRGKILVTLIHAHNSVKVRWLPFCFRGKGLVTFVADPVTFDIRFVYDIQAQLIAQLIKFLVVGVVRAPHTIEIEIFHYGDVLQHRL